MNNMLFIFSETDALNNQPEFVIQKINDSNPEFLYLLYYLQIHSATMNFYLSGYDKIRPHYALK